MFCFHKWKVKRIVFHPPRNVDVEGFTTHLMRIWMHGFSNIHFECTKCGFIRTEEEYGDARTLIEGKN